MSAAPIHEQADPEHARPRERDPVDAEPAVPVDDRCERELRRDQERRRRDDPDARAGDRDREDDADAHHAAKELPLGTSDRVAHASERAPRDEQDAKRQRGSDDRCRGGGFDAPDALVQPSLNGDLDRPGESCRGGEHGGESGRAHGEDAIRSPASPRKERMIRAIILYESEPDPERYQRHIDEFLAPSSARRSATARCSARRSANPRTATTPSSSGTTWSRSRPRSTRKRSPLRARTRWRWASRSPFTSRRSSDRADPSAPRRSRGARLRGDRLREGAAARDDPAEPSGRPQRVRLQDAPGDRTRVRGRVVGRRRPSRRGHGHRTRVLRRRRPPLVGRGPPRELERVLEVVRRVQGHARPAARDRQADDRARQRDRRRRRERAADGVRPLGDGRRARSSGTSGSSTARCPREARPSGSS